MLNACAMCTGTSSNLLFPIQRPASIDAVHLRRRFVELEAEADAALAKYRSQLTEAGEPAATDEQQGEEAHPRFAAPPGPLPNLVPLGVSSACR